jgi:hypothetical protein
VYHVAFLVVRRARMVDPTLHSPVEKNEAPARAYRKDRWDR